MVGQIVSHYRSSNRSARAAWAWSTRRRTSSCGRHGRAEVPAGRPQPRSRHDRAVPARSPAASSLNHPHICTIYEVDEHEGSPFLAMELLEGRTLDRRIDGRPLEMGLLLRLALADRRRAGRRARRGILHRDVKPANIFVTTRPGEAARLRPGQADGPRGDDQPCRSSPPAVLTTRQGTAMGTVAYMSPEQARGEELDARSDLFSFGVVLYEMATGQQTFQGSTTAARLRRHPEPRPAGADRAERQRAPRARARDRPCVGQGPDSVPDDRRRCATTWTAWRASASSAVNDSSGAGDRVSPRPAAPAGRRLSAVRRPCPHRRGGAAHARPRRRARAVAHQPRAGWPARVAVDWAWATRPPASPVRARRPGADRGLLSPPRRVAVVPADNRHPRAGPRRLQRRAATRDPSSPLPAPAVPRRQQRPRRPRPVETAALKARRGRGGVARLNAAQAKFDSGLYDQALADAQEHGGRGPDGGLDAGGPLLIGRIFERQRQPR